MNRFKTIARIFSGLFAGALLLTSCLSEDNDWDNPKSTTGKEVSIRFTVQMPRQGDPGTYAISKEDENFVKEIDILSFKPVTVDAAHPSGFAFAYRAKVSGAITGSGTDNREKQFDVTLIKDKTNTQTFAILANVRALVDAQEQLGMAEGTDMDELLARLTLENPASWNANLGKEETDASKTFTPFPMWGKASELIDDNITAITGVSLVRGIARMDVLLATEVNNFVLNEIYIYNSKSKGQVVPATANLESAGKVKAATVPTGTINNDSPLVYPVMASMNTSFEREIYLFEALAVAQNEPSKATCIVVGGTYGSDLTPTYYRLDFFKRDDQKQITKDYKDILRNHQYRVNIKSVGGSGYNTPEEAFNSKSINMIADVVEWDDGGIGDIVFDGQYALSVKKVEYNFSRDALTAKEEKNTFIIFTDYDVEPNSGWKIPAGNIVDAVTGLPVAWVKVMKGSTQATEGDANNPANLWLQVDENAGSNARSAKIIVVAGRLRYTVTVNQSLTPDIGLSILNPLNNKEITELVFASVKDAIPAAQQYKVNFAPKAANLLVSSSTIGNPAFTFNTGSDIVSSTTLIGQNGTVSYTIQPTAITTTDVSDNPFLERTSEIKYTVSNGVTYESKSIFLRQMVYNIVTDEASTYLMNGGQHSFTVKANTTWTATIVSAPNNCISSITQSGGPNTTTGTDFYFTTVDDLTNPTLYTRTAKVMFSSPDGRFADKEVIINCVSGKLVDPSNSYIVNPSGVGILIPVDQANKGVAGSIGDDDVYTADLLWTDNSEVLKATGAVSRIIVSGKGKTGYVLVLPGSSEGNSVVTVKVGGAIKWSWHIWTTGYDPEKDGQNTNNGYTFMDRNLGAYGLNCNNNATTDFSKTGLLYQWGRKDPFPGAVGTSGVIGATIYDKDGIGKATTTPAMTSIDLAKSIAQPLVWSGDWTGSNGATSWDNGNKTPYDPCPPGWRAPKSDAWVGLYANGTWNLGFTWPGAGYYPASGRRQPFGDIGNVGNNGFCWSRSSSSDNNSIALLSQSSTIAYNGGYDRKFGYPVRCVRE